MSDAITLDVLSSSPVQLDAGDADPIAREEIAALATRVTTVEGDVSGLSTRMGAVEGDVTALDGRMDAAEGDISTLGTTVDGIDARSAVSKDLRFWFTVHNGHLAIADAGEQPVEEEEE